jgi:poly-gamma-glutamate synthesis protein (capsule biosynthesis protein)
MEDMKKQTLLFVLCSILSICSISACGQKESGGAEALPDKTVVEESIDANLNAAEESADSPQKEAPQVHLIMVGDVLLHTPVEESCMREDGSYSYDALFAQTKEQIGEADLALVNQEVIIGGTELGITGYPSFNASFSLCDSLVDAGFDVICHATNHAMDKGKKGIVACSEYWEEHYPDIEVLGIHSEKQTSTAYGAEPYLYVVQGADGDTLTLAILNYTYGTNGIALPEDMPYAVDLMDEKQVVEDIQRAEELADFTIVCPHWGTEYRLQPDSYQEKWTRIFLQNGVDLVLGTHPHVIEPIEWVRDEENGHEMLVYYSLGNYVNWTPVPEREWLTAW